MKPTQPPLLPERLDLAEQFFFRLQQCANMLQKTGTRVVGGDKLTTQQCAVLDVLTRPSVPTGMSVGDLARHLMVSRQNLSGVLNRMARAGYLSVTTDERDRRARLVTLTDAGRKTWETQVTPKLHQYYDQTLVNFSDDDIRRSLRHMLRLLDNMKVLDADADPGTQDEDEGDKGNANA